MKGEFGWVRCEDGKGIWEGGMGTVLKGEWVEEKGVNRRGRLNVGMYKDGRGISWKEDFEEGEGVRI